MTPHITVIDILIRMIRSSILRLVSAVQVYLINIVSRYINPLCRLSWVSVLILLAVKLPCCHDFTVLYIAMYLKSVFVKILGRKTWQFVITSSYCNDHYFCKNDFALLRGKPNVNARISPMQTLVNVVEAHTGVTQEIFLPYCSTCTQSPPKIIVLFCSHQVFWLPYLTGPLKLEQLI